MDTESHKPTAGQLYMARWANKTWREKLYGFPGYVNIKKLNYYWTDTETLLSMLKQLEQQFRMDWAIRHQRQLGEIIRPYHDLIIQVERMRGIRAELSRRMVLYQRALL